MGLTGGHVETVKQIEKELNKDVVLMDAATKKAYLSNIAVKLAIPDEESLQEQVAEEQAELEAKRKEYEGNKRVANVFKDCQGMSPEDAKAYKSLVLEVVSKISKA